MPPSYPHRQQTYLRAELARTFTPGNGVTSDYARLADLTLDWDFTGEL